LKSDKCARLAFVWYFFDLTWFPVHEKHVRATSES
jgi:hypothetical protein